MSHKPDIPPGFCEMPAMVTVPIIGHTACEQPIAPKGKDVASACTGEPPRTANVD